MGTRFSGRCCCREVAVVKRFKQESMYELSAGTKKEAVVERFKQESMYELSAGTKERGRCREVAQVSVLLTRTSVRAETSQGHPTRI